MKNETLKNWKVENLNIGEPDPFVIKKNCFLFSIFMLSIFDFLHSQFFNFEEMESFLRSPIGDLRFLAPAMTESMHFQNPKASASGGTWEAWEPASLIKC